MYCQENKTKILELKTALKARAFVSLVPVKQKVFFNFYYNELKFEGKEKGI